MGKISEAFERRQKERTIRLESVANIKGKWSAPEEREPTLYEGSPMQGNYSPKLFALSSPDSIDAECFRVLRAHLLFSGNHQERKIIMVTSAFPGEGKTFLSVNLAVSLACGTSQKVLFIDCDLRRPQAHTLLGHSNTKGLHEYLAGKEPLQDMVIPTPIENLSFLPAGNVATNPTEIMSSTAMEAFLEEIKHEYQDSLIIIDSAPTQAIAEAKLLAKYVDGIIFLVMAGKAPREAIQKSIETLGKNKIVGIVFNGYNKAHRDYYKYYDKYYR